MESWKSFKLRVKKATGFDINDIPTGDVLDLVDKPHVLCRCGQVYIVRVEDPVIGPHSVERDPETGHTEVTSVDEPDHFRYVYLPEPEEGWPRP